MKNKEEFLNKIIDDLPIAEYRSQMTKDEWKGWFEDAYNEGYKQAQALQLQQTGVMACFSEEQLSQIKKYGKHQHNRASMDLSYISFEFWLK